MWKVTNLGCEHAIASIDLKIAYSKVQDIAGLPSNCVGTGKYRWSLKTLLRCCS